MTTSTFAAPRTLPASAPPSALRRRLRALRVLRALVTLVCLALIWAGQVALAMRPGLNATAFEDEGLYIFMGHRMIQHISQGAFLQAYPGAYFSGAPGFYPVLAAIGDYFGGLQGARMVSLGFAILATVGVYGLGNQLFGRVARSARGACLRAVRLGDLPVAPGHL